MSYLVDTNEELSELLQKEIRKFKRKVTGSDASTWYHINAVVARARDTSIRHNDINLCVMPNLFNEKGDMISWYYWRDPQSSQVREVKKNLKRCNKYRRRRGYVSAPRLKEIMEEILHDRLEQYTNPKPMEKLKILCIIGDSGSGKTLASLHLKNHNDANVICSFTTRPPRMREVEGRDHHFIDIVPDRTELLAFTHFGDYYYYALKSQVHGPCTVYVIDEKGLDNLLADHGDTYDIYTMYIKRSRKERRRVGVDTARMRRDEHRRYKDESEYDYVVDNNGTKVEFFRQIEKIYEEIKNK